jgi:hypothetical protein
MKTDKLREAIRELKEQQAVIGDALVHMEQALAVLEGGNPISQAQSTVTEAAKGEAVQKPAKTFIDEGVEILGAAGRPLHIKDITFQISKRRDRNIPRAFVESSFARHITNLEERSRVRRVRPGYYGLPEWPESAEKQLSM